jgi:hypothetical protein
MLRWAEPELVAGPDVPIRCYAQLPHYEDRGSVYAGFRLGLGPAPKIDDGTTRFSRRRHRALRVIGSQGLAARRTIKTWRMEAGEIRAAAPLTACSTVCKTMKVWLTTCDL